MQRMPMPGIDTPPRHQQPYIVLTLWRMGQYRRQIRLSFTCLVPVTKNNRKSSSKQFSGLWVKQVWFPQFRAREDNRETALSGTVLMNGMGFHDDVIKWKHFPRYWPFVTQVTGSFDVSLMCAWTNGLANNRGAGDLRPHRGHYDVIDCNVF